MAPAAWVSWPLKSVQAGVDVGEHVGDLDVRTQPLHVALQPCDGGVVGQRVVRQDLEAIARQPHAVTSVERPLQLAQRHALVCLELEAGRNHGHGWGESVAASGEL